MRGPHAHKTVLCHGTFDLLHLGHIRHLQEARAQGDRLVVSVTPDRHVNKGMDRPHFTAEQRVEALKSLLWVDDAFVADGPTAVGSIEAIRPAVYVKGCDYADANDTALQAEIAAAKKHGGRFYTTVAEKVSSSRLLNAQRFPSETYDYLQSARQRNFLDKIETAFAAADRLQILFVGETIIDEYRYVSALGKPSKEFMLATVEERRERFKGGIEAAAKHCEWPHASVAWNGNVPIIKTRFVDADFTRKLFEVYSRAQQPMTQTERDVFRAELADRVGYADVVVVMDFGHGLLGERERTILMAAKFLAVNAQTNAGNAGFNRVTKYSSAELVCIDEPEARLAAGLQNGSADECAAELFAQIACDAVIVTRGRNGAFAKGAGEAALVPPFGYRAVDTIGAGDAFLAAAAPLFAAGLEPEACAFVGNVAGAIKTTVVGHRSHVTRSELMQNIKALLA